MEAKLIIYIIGGVLYFLYTIGKKVEANKKKASGTGTPPTKPVSPPASKSLNDVMQDVKRMQVEQEAKKRRVAEAAKPVPTIKQAKQNTTLISELEKRGRLETEMEKQTSPVMIAAEISEMDLLHADSYTHKEEETQPYEIDAKQAFIGSIIFERKF